MGKSQINFLNAVGKMTKIKSTFFNGSNAKLLVEVRPQGQQQQQQQQ